MRSIFRQFILTASCMALLGLSTKSHGQRSGCIVPERIHLSGLIFMKRADAEKAAALLAYKSFAALGKSMPTSYAPNIGWFTPAQLRGSNYAAAAGLSAGETTKPLTVPGLLQTEILHVDEIRGEMPCAQAISQYPHDSWPRLVRAAQEIHRHDLSAAISDYSAILVYDPKLPTARFGRGEAYYIQGHYKRALGDADRAVVSNSGDAYTLKALVEAAIGEDDLATADARQGIAQYDGPGLDDSPARFALGTAYSDLGYFAASIHEQNEVLRKHPRDVQPLLARSFARFSLGDIPGALRDDAAASSALPTWNRPYLVHAIISFALGRAHKALRYAEHARTLSPQNAYAQLWVLVTKHALHEAPSAADSRNEQPTGPWPHAVINAFLGRVSFASLSMVPAGHSLTEQVRACEANFYRGAYLWSANERAALPYLRVAATECPYREYERVVAADLLRLER